MINVLVAAPASGSGKTTLTCALLAAMQRRGYHPCAFKCGPDYLDPQFHRTVLGVESHNLDLFLSPADTVRRIYRQGAAGHDAAVCEAAMGFYDGVGGTTEQASGWQTAEVLSLPVLLVVNPKGSSLTLAAQLLGLAKFRTPSHIAAVFLNRCSANLYRMLAPMLEQETGIPVIGYLPDTVEAELPGRHLGLVSPSEIPSCTSHLAAVADILCETLDWNRLEKLFAVPNTPSEISTFRKHIVTVAVARDEAFSFVYAETLEALREAGAALRFFSPLRDKCLPEDADALYLPGGYPELYAEQLSKNEAMKHTIKSKMEGGMPTVAECGGFLYLGTSLQNAEGTSLPMAGVLPGSAADTGHLVRFGYAYLCAETDSLLFRKGERFPIHEFHHWDSTANGTAFTAKKAMSGQTWQCGFASPTLYAGFPHLYFAGTPFAQRLVEAAQRYQRKKQ